jgi:hypothetical protein
MDMCSSTAIHAWFVHSASAAYFAVFRCISLYFALAARTERAAQFSYLLAFLRQEPLFVSEEERPLLIAEARFFEMREVLKLFDESSADEELRADEHSGDADSSDLSAELLENDRNAIDVLEESVEQLKPLRRALLHVAEAKRVAMEKQKLTWKCHCEKLDRMCTAEKVKLDVGGKRFSISRNALLSHGPSYFTSMLSGKFAAQQEDGTYWIEQDPTGFHLLLDVLRGVDPNTMALSDVEYAALKHKLKFFQLHGVTFKSRASEFTSLPERRARSSSSPSKFDEACKPQ